MGCKECPNCHKGLMVRHGSRYRGLRKCTKCGFMEDTRYNISKECRVESHKQEDYAIAVAKRQIKKGLEAFALNEIK